MCMEAASSSTASVMSRALQSEARHPIQLGSWLLSQTSASQWRQQFGFSCPMNRVQCCPVAVAAVHVLKRQYPPEEYPANEDTKGGSLNPGQDDPACNWQILSHTWGFNGCPMITNIYSWKLKQFPLDQKGSPRDGDLRSLVNQFELLSVWM